jgi:hypothetical protein
MPTPDQRHNSNAFPALAAAQCSASAWRKRERLFIEAVQALNALSNYLEEVGDKPRMYKVNGAIQKLWKAE